MDTIIGLIMIYVWVHGAIIVGKKVQGITQYENVVLIVGAVAFVIFIYGAI